MTVGVSSDATMSCAPSASARTVEAKVAPLTYTMLGLRAPQDGRVPLPAHAVRLPRHPRATITNPAISTAIPTAFGGGHGSFSRAIPRVAPIGMLTWRNATT